MTQNPGGGDNSGPPVPPEGLLANAVLAQDEIITPKEPAAPKPNDATSPAVVGDGYKEPTSLQAYCIVADNISRYESLDKKCKERGVVIDFLLQRINVLQTALMPFATQAMVLANARMALMAVGSNDPAGGTWFSNPPQGIQMQATEGLFFNACDALGRGHVEDCMARTFEAVQQRAKEQAEKDKAVEAGETIH